MSQKMHLIVYLGKSNHIVRFVICMTLNDLQLD